MGSLVCPMAMAFDMAAGDWDEELSWYDDDRIDQLMAASQVSDVNSEHQEVNNESDMRMLQLVTMLSDLTKQCESLQQRMIARRDALEADKAEELAEREERRRLRRERRRQRELEKVQTPELIPIEEEVPKGYDDYKIDDGHTFKNDGEDLEKQAAIERTFRGKGCGVMPLVSKTEVQDVKPTVMGKGKGCQRREEVQKVPDRIVAEPTDENTEKRNMGFKADKVEVVKAASEGEGVKPKAENEGKYNAEVKSKAENLPRIKEVQSVAEKEGKVKAEVNSKAEDLPYMNGMHSETILTRREVVEMQEKKRKRKQRR